MQVDALQPVAGLNRRDLLVLAVVDHALAAARAVVGKPLPPGQDRLPVELLHPEVGRELVGGQRLEPDHVARGVEHHRAVLKRAVLRGQEDVAAIGRRRAPVDCDRRRHQVGARLEVLYAVRPGGDHRQLHRVDRAERHRDPEMIRPVRTADHVQPRGHGHGLPGRERLARDEAPALPVGVGLDRAAMRAAAGPDDRDVTDLARRDAPERDLGPGLGASRARAREHGHRRRPAPARSRAREQQDGGRHPRRRIPMRPPTIGTSIVSEPPATNIKPATASNVAPRRLACAPYGPFGRRRAD